jgi:hypothetical protein
MKLRIVKDRSGLLERPWHVQTVRGVTLESFCEWEHARIWATFRRPYFRLLWFLWFWRP